MNGHWVVADSVFFLDRENGTAAIATSNGTIELDKRAVQNLRIATGEWLVDEIHLRTVQ